MTLSAETAGTVEVLIRAEAEIGVLYPPIDVRLSLFLAVVTPVPFKLASVLAADAAVLRKTSAAFESG